MLQQPPKPQPSTAKTTAQKPQTAKKSFFKQHPKLKKGLIISGSILGGLILLVAISGGIVYAVYGKDFTHAYEQATAGKTDLEAAQNLIKSQQLEPAKNKVVAARTDFQNAQSALGRVSWLNAIPLVHRQLFAVDQLLSASVQLTYSLEKLVGSTERITAPLTSEKVTDFHSLSPEQKRDMLAAFHDESPVFETVKQELTKTQATIDSIPDFGTLRQIRTIKQTATEKLPDFRQAIDEILVFSKILPDIAGYKEARDYLFLFQNNTELRPSGGFIGTYGILTLENGEIKKFVSDNVYNIDKEGQGDKNPPAPIKKYINPQWFFRDANWSPDFPTSAKKAEEFYHREGGQGEFYGVIGVTPTMLQALLEVTGPVKVKGYPYEFTKDNTVDQLEIIVERAFVNLGIAEKDRKDIIGEFSTVVLDKLFTLPKEKWIDFADLVVDQFHQKHAMMVVDDEDIQKTISEQNWDSRVKETDGDYIQYVDANLASLKTDQVMKRTIDYYLDATDLSNPKATVTMTYNHAGKGFDWKTTRYNTYSRLLVPEGSQFVSVKGQHNANSDRRYNDAIALDVTSELGKASFGGYKSIEPKDTEQTIIEYTLPARIGDQIRQGHYSLMVQKQPGTIDEQLHVHIKFPKNINAISPKELGRIEKDKEVDFTTDLVYDREFTVTF